MNQLTRNSFKMFKNIYCYSLIYFLLSVYFSVYSVAANYALISDIGSSAQSIAMGNIDGFSDPATAVFDNPASIQRTNKLNASIFYSNFFDEIRYLNLSTSFKTLYGNFGMGFYSASVPGIPLTGISDDLDQSFYVKNYYSYSNSVFKAAYQRNISYRSSVGLSLALFYSKNHTISSFAKNLDFGLLHTINHQLTLSVFAQNIIPFMSANYSNGYSEPLPFTLSSSLAYDYRHFTIMPQLKYTNSHILKSLGLKWNVFNLSYINLLAGYKEQLDYTNTRHSKATIGFSLHLFGTNFYYAYERSDYYLSDNHTYFSVNYAL